jgi:hypothetical protein
MEIKSSNPALLAEGKKGREHETQEDRDRASSYIENNLPSGTQEELQEAFDKYSEYLYKILDYAEDESLTKEQLEEAKRHLYFVKHGPRAKYLLGNRRGKLTSADVFYILVTTTSSPKLAEVFGVTRKEICAIRRGDSSAWRWEYDLVRKLSRDIRFSLKRFDPYNRSVVSKSGKYSKRVAYRCWKVTPESKEELFLITSMAKAKRLRKDLIPVKEYALLEKRGALDVLYPIEIADVLC